MAMVDLILAILHHLLVFALVAALAAEIVLVRSGLPQNGLSRLAIIDRVYGMSAMLVVVVGVGRVLFGLKGWDFYVGSWSFWGKMAAFVVVALLSSRPTMLVLSWRRWADAEPGFTVPAAELATMRSFLRAEMVAFTPIPVLAAMMARGYGS